MQYAEGGENGFEHRLPGQLKYSTIKLSRPLDARTDPRGGGLATWFTSLGRQFTRSSAAKTAAITAFDSTGQKIASWSLVDAYPFRWTGPSFSADGNAVAKETLELAHNGFIDS
jgi:phage tail-like protein